MRFLNRVLTFAVRTLTTERWRAKLILRIAALGGDDILPLAYFQMGILRYKNTQVSGEDYLIQKILPRLVSRDKPVIMDVGANTGHYSLLIRHHFPKARIFAFEPVAATFGRLQENTATKDIQCHHMGLGAEAATATIFLQSDTATSEWASIYRDVSQSIHRIKTPRAEAISIQTLDAFCATHDLTTIDFLKIDTEGHELSVLRGAQGLISRGAITLIQFEFNEMNVFSRVFLKDFYDLLPGYRFYRLNTNGPIPLGAYKTRYEIFQFQNIVAVQEKWHLPFENQAP